MLQILQFVADVAELFTKKGATKCCKVFKECRKWCTTYKNSVNVKLQVFRVLLMTRRLRKKKKEKLQILLSFQTLQEQ